MYLKQSHLRLMVRIAETGKLQAAAESLAMSQPAASRILSDLETQAKGSLFLRHPKGMTLTQSGEIFVRRARVILKEFDALEEEVAQINSGRAGEVRIGSVTGPAVGCLVPALRHVKTVAPKVEPTIEVGTSAQLFRGLQEGRFDFILARAPSEYDTRNFRFMPAKSEVISLVVQQGHPLLVQPIIRLADLGAFEWIIQERGSPVRQAVESAFHDAGLATPENITNTSSLLVVLAMLEHSTAIAPLTQEVADLLTRQTLHGSLAVLDLERTVSVTPYFIIHERNRQFSPAARLLLDEVIVRL